MLVRLAALLLFLTGPALAAIGPEEVMEDPALHARAMQLYEDLRCVQCRSENIASSNADWARDARAVVRERLLEGDSDREVMAFFQARYGDYVLMDPPVSSENIGLWLAGPMLLLVGLGVALTFVRRRGRAPAQDDLSQAEAERVAELLNRKPQG